MNIQKLNVFITLVETRKMTDTAKLLGLSTPTVSFHVKSLEEDYDIKLFRTNAGGYRLTDGGEMLYHYAKQLSQTNSALEKSVEDYKNGEKGSIKLGASGVPAQLFMPELIHQLAERYPRIKVSLDVKTAPEIEKRLLLQELDCGLVMETGNKEADLVYEPITSDKIVLAFSKIHSFAGKTALAENDLYDQTLLVHRLSSSTGRFSKSWLQEKKLKMEMIQLDSVSTIIKMLSYGKAVALISKRLIEKEDHLSYIEFQNQDLERQIHFVYHRNLWISSPFRYFQELVLGLKEDIQ
ncbi:transcriptional regulator, LysR family [Gracilibacillus orientalis]|uniref:Transcriptional regulator, LysR family n=1 Tax=Gracilibacillus orientalis TaxID=334253 RepID=A0A1I4HTN8_9BACI|nr:LysR family transcriptional regulator [Gracilibacillus orientalis]SFL45414.1 transcriptional regulator, LysR family [Gracilibacillus orientalis]